MRIRGRRVALLLTGVLPLLAEDDVPATETNATTFIEQDERDEHATTPFRIGASSLVLNELPLTSSNPGNVVMVLDPIFDTTDTMTVLQQSHNHTKDNLVHNMTPPKESALPATQQHDDDVETLVQTEDAETNATTQDNETLSVESMQNNETSPAESTDTAAASDTEESPAETGDSESQNASNTQGGSTEESGDDEDGPIERLLVDYASKSAGALILEKSPSMKGASNLLNGDNDQYAIVPCADKKFVVVGLIRRYSGQASQVG